MKKRINKESLILLSIPFLKELKIERHTIYYRMEDVGGELNAYTTKEDTCIYSSFMPKYYARAIELLYDITFNSIFPSKELMKEKAVVIDEINSYKRQSFRANF